MVIRLQTSGFIVLYIIINHFLKLFNFKLCLVFILISIHVFNIINVDATIFRIDTIDNFQNIWISIPCKKGGVGIWRIKLWFCKTLNVIEVFTNELWIHWQRLFLQFYIFSWANVINLLNITWCFWLSRH